MSVERVFLKITGIVQGVGFRPFVYNLATSLNLKGWVNNNSEGVYIDIEGERRHVKEFIAILRNNPPPLSHIDKIITEEKPFLNLKIFEIRRSEKKDSMLTFISPDIAMCKKCEADILDESNRRYKYAFTNCTNCGPRFSIIKDVPYDREKTTMEHFKMCSLCSDEYKNPSNRRFHAQPNACSSCGPRLWLYDNKGSVIKVSDEIEWTKYQLKAGKIFAVKGLGGFHLVCDAKNSEAVKALRIRKGRPHKAFAVMMKDMETVRKYCKVSSAEESILTGIRKPILLMNTKKMNSLPENIAPKLNTLGVMLPYTPLHQLLFDKELEILIMTSANINGLPLEYDNESALKKLVNIADFFLFHNRDINQPIDDSVARVINEEESIIRRARGYTPEPIKIDVSEGILSCGSNMKNTFAVSKNDFIFLSQHNGDLQNIETYNRYKNNIEFFKHIFSFNAKYAACDLHPDYLSTNFASSLNIPIIGIQHHHAHIVSCMAENNIRENTIGVCFDGTGLGTDGNIWGGEFLICSYKSFERAAHLKYVRMPGGEKAITEPWRMGVSHLLSAYGIANLSKNINSETGPPSELKDIYKIIFDNYGIKGVNLIPIVQKALNSPLTSSIGRLFDAAASLLSFKDNISYEGQASIELEAIIDCSTEDFYRYTIKKENNNYIIDPTQIFKDILLDKKANINIGIISAKFHNTIVNITAALCRQLRADTGINKVALSGGVFQNYFLLEKTMNSLKKDNFEIYFNRIVPCNDGGISLGQIVIANERIKHTGI